MEVKREYNILSFGISKAPSRWVVMLTNGVVNRMYYTLCEGAGYIRKGKKYYFKKDHLYILSPFQDVEYFIENHDFYHAYIDYVDMSLCRYDDIMEIDVSKHPMIREDVNMFLGFLKNKNITLADSTVNTEDFYRYKERVSIIADGLFYDIGEIFTKSEINSLIVKSIKYIQTNYINDIKVEHLAKMSNLSKNQYTRIFYKDMGVTPYQYLKKYRMEMAYMMLLGDVTVGEVAERCGFLSVSAFSNCFKKFFGYSPTNIINKEV